MTHWFQLRVTSPSVNSQTALLLDSELRTHIEERVRPSRDGLRRVKERRDDLILPKGRACRKVQGDERIRERRVEARHVRDKGFHIRREGERIEHGPVRHDDNGVHGERL